MFFAIGFDSKHLPVLKVFQYHAFAYGREDGRYMIRRIESDLAAMLGMASVCVSVCCNRDLCVCVI